MSQHARRLLAACVLLLAAAVGVWTARTFPESLAEAARIMPVSVALTTPEPIAPHVAITIVVESNLPVTVVAITPTQTPVETPSATQTPVDTSTATQTPTTVPSVTTQPTDTATPQPTATRTATRTPSPTPTLAPTPLPTVTSVPAGVAAFPGAEGFGTQAVGGRGGRVYLVTTLADSGAGSLRECVAASGPRICVFRIGGTIELRSTLTVANPYLTIAGQTAPGGGITLKVADPSRSIDMFKITTYEVIVRYVRFRPGTKGQDARALTINAGGSVPADRVAANIVVDHCSFSWAGDEIIIAWDRTHDVTFSYNIFAESLTPGLKGPNLGKYGGGNYSVHHNLIAHHSYRLPNISTSGGPTDLVNNVIYNYKTFGARVLLGAMVNMVGNWIEAGPDTSTGSYYVRNDLDVPDPDSSVPLPNPDTRGFFVAYNYLQGNYNGTLRIRDILPPATKASDIHEHRYLAPQVTTLTAQDAYTDVLANAGAIRGLACDGSWVARPDAVDSRIVESVRRKTSSHNLASPKLGYIADPSEVGGWPVLAAGAPCADQDGDFLPDAFETRYGLTNGVNDTNRLHLSGWSYLEVYMNGGY